MQITLDTEPGGLQLVYDGVSGTAPLTHISIVGSSHTISAPSPQAGNLVFVSWSDGGAQQHTITVGSSPTTYTATFAPDTTAPVISNVRVQQITANSAIITWTTDEPADSQVDYGLSTSYGSSVFDPVLVKEHRVQLTELKSNTTYHFRVVSRDSVGNRAESADFTFTTKRR